MVSDNPSYSSSTHKVLDCYCLSFSHASHACHVIHKLPHLTCNVPLHCFPITKSDSAVLRAT